MESTILITGVTSGIGFALAQEFANLGHIVIGCGRNQEKISLLQKEFGARHQFSVVDVRIPDQVEHWAKNAYGRYPKIDIIINNAAVKGELCPLWETSADDFAQVVDTNITGVANIIRSFVPKMVALKCGTIINLSSEWGRTADAYAASYCASKFAIEGLTKSLAKELPKGMATVALSPLIVWTSMLEEYKSLLLPGEYELGITPAAWAKFAAPKMLALGAADNGTSPTWSPNL